MSSKTIRLILSLMLLTIGALFVTQIYWFNKSFALEEQQFDEQINIALRNVADQLLKWDNDSTSRIAPISKQSSNEYFVKTNCYFSLISLDNCIKNEFYQRGIDVSFDYLILNADTGHILLGNTFTNSINSTSNLACKDRVDNQENLNFKIRINNKKTYLLSTMGIWIYSSFSLLILLAVFTFIMVSIIKGKKLSELKNDFVNNMTHELKTPIANISVASDAIRNDKIQMDDIKLKKYANIIYNENVRLHHLVDRVLQISAIEKKEESLFMEEIDLHQIIHKVSFSFQPLIQQRNGSIHSILNAHHFKLKADKTHLSNVIYNLIENAIKYSDSSPDIIIKTTNQKGGINVAVEDKGIGMNHENQDRIFEKFFRAETGNLHNTKGYGLGLSYVKLIIEKHNGLITFKSKENIGSTFNIFLPVYNTS